MIEWSITVSVNICFNSVYTLLYVFIFERWENIKLKINEMTEIDNEKIRQLISRTDMTGNEKVEWLINFLENDYGHIC